MEWLSFDGLNWWAILVAFLASFALGWFWYSPAGFFPVWKRLAGFTSEQMENANMGVAFGGTIVANLLGVVLTAVLMNAAGVEGLWPGLVFGLLVGIIYRGGAHALHNGFAIRHPGITLIDTAHDAVALAIVGAILGVWM